MAAMAASTSCFRLIGAIPSFGIRTSSGKTVVFYWSAVQ
jgi:hypothetical protein